MTEVATDARERILAVASELMAERGYAGTPIAEIAKRSACTPPTIYWHFGSKEGVLHAVLRDGAKKYFSTLPRMATLEGNAEERLDALLAGAAAGLAAGPPFLRLLLLLTLERTSDQATLDVIREMRETARSNMATWFADYFVESFATDGGPAIDVRPLAEKVAGLAVAVTDGLLIEQVLHPETADIGEAFQAFRKSLPSLGEAFRADVPTAAD